jgi:hypothetical protein
MKRLVLVLVLLALPLSESSAQLPTLLCSAVKKWKIRLTTMKVTKTPNDPGSHEEWTQNFILQGAGFPSSSFQARTFEINPHDEITNKHPVEVIPLPSIGALEMDNSRATDHVSFSGKERDSWPNPDDKLPHVDFTLTNPCKVSTATLLTSVTEFVKAIPCQNDNNRGACYTITVTPL